MNTATIDEATQLMRQTPDEFSEQVMEAIEDILDIAEANHRLTNPKPGKSKTLEEIIKQYDLDD